MIDHDQRFKTILREFFEPFLNLFFAHWADRFDFGSVEWLDKELFANPPDGSRHILDLVARVRLKKPVVPSPCPDVNELLAAVWIEIEARDSLERLRPRLPDAYLHLRRTYGIPVLPIGFFLRVGLDGLGVDVVEERFGELTPLRFEYLYVGLPALDGVHYLEEGGALGVALASLMHLPHERIAELGAEAFRKLQQATLSDQKRFLLADCFQQYALADPDDRDAFLRLIQNADYEEVRTMTQSMFDQIRATSFEEGIEKGLKQGLEQGLEQGLHQGLEQGSERGRLLALQQANRRLLTARFGPLTTNTESRLKSLSADELEELLVRIVEAQSLAELGFE